MPDEPYKNREIDNMYEVLIQRISALDSDMKESFKKSSENMDSIQSLLKQTYDQARQTNGRVSNLEEWKEKKDPIIKNLEKHRWSVLAVITFIGFMIPIIGIILATQ